MIKFAHKISEEMNRRLHDLSYNGTSGLEYIQKCYQITNNSLKELREALTQYRFKTLEDEVEFFKNIKPTIHAQVLFFIELYQIELNKPSLNEVKKQLSYYKKLSSYYSQLLGKNSLMQLYHKTQRSAEDHQLFCRNSTIPYLVPIDPLEEFDAIFPPASTELSRIIAYEKVLDHISQTIKSIRTGSKQPSLYQTTGMNWTGSKIELIELAYALHSTNCINNGKIEIKRIITTLEQVFNVELGAFYRIFQNIRIRQGSRTAFMDQLRDKLLDRMDSTDLR